MRQWEAILAVFPEWNASPETVTLDTVAAWGADKRSAKAVALARVVRFGRQHRHQTTVNKGLVDGEVVHLADLCAAFGCSERQGRNARDIWDWVASHGGVLPDEWYGLGSGDVHDMVKGRPRRTQQKLTPSQVVLRVRRLLDANIPSGSPDRVKVLDDLQAWLDGQRAVEIAPTEVEDTDDKSLVPVDPNSWKDVEMLRTLSPPDLAALVARQCRMRDKVWVAYAVQTEPVKPRDLVDFVYGPDDSTHPGNPTRGIREALTAMCVERDKHGRTLFFVPMDATAHGEQVRYRRARQRSDDRVKDSLGKLAERLAVIEEEQAHEKAA